MKTSMKFISLCMLFFGSSLLFGMDLENGGAGKEDADIAEKPTELLRLPKPERKQLLRQLRNLEKSDNPNHLKQALIISAQLYADSLGPKESKATEPLIERQVTIHRKLAKLLGNEEQEADETQVNEFLGILAPHLAVLRSTHVDVGPEPDYCQVLEQLFSAESTAITSGDQEFQNATKTKERKEQELKALNTKVKETRSQLEGFQAAAETEEAKLEALERELQDSCIDVGNVRIHMAEIKKIQGINRRARLGIIAHLQAKQERIKTVIKGKEETVRETENVLQDEDLDEAKEALENTKKELQAAREELIRIEATLNKLQPKGWFGWLWS